MAFKSHHLFTVFLVTLFTRATWIWPVQHFNIQNKFLPNSHKTNFFPKFIRNKKSMESSAIRYKKLYYPGSGNDIKPLPVTKSVIYVDFAPMPLWCKDEKKLGNIQ